MFYYLYDVDVYSYAVRDTYSSSMIMTPSLGVIITNTGTNNDMYFGGYELLGMGANTSVASIGDIVELGYKTVKAVGSVGNLSISTVFDLLGEYINLNKSTSGSRKLYVCMPTPLSNPAQNKFSYGCLTPCPFSIRYAEDYVTLKLGIIGTPVSSTRYSFNVTIAQS